MQVMAVINVTPDSFFDGGVNASTDHAVAAAMRCIADGADVLDIGGASSRPGAESVPLAEELRRVLPVVEGIRKKNPTIPISIDTTQSAVIRETSRFGIHYANDISALRVDPEMAATVAALGLTVILMHMQGSPATMQHNPQYDDVVAEVCDFLAGQSEVAMRHGIPKAKIMLDPGIGFGKTVTHNVELLQNLSRFTDLGCPLVVGTSRKSFIAQLVNQPHSGVEGEAPTALPAEGATLAPKNRLAGSLATLPCMHKAGVAMVRTHDVAETKQFLAILEQLV